MLRESAERGERATRQSPKASGKHVAPDDMLPAPTLSDLAQVERSAGGRPAENSYRDGTSYKQVLSENGEEGVARCDTYPIRPRSDPLAVIPGGSNSPPAPGRESARDGGGKDQDFEEESATNVAPSGLIREGDLS